MCDTYDAIYEIKKTAKSDHLMLWVDKAKIKGNIAHCDCGCDGKCLNGIITLKDASIHCRECNETVTMKWINVSSKWIKAFAFED